MAGDEDLPSLDDWGPYDEDLWGPGAASFFVPPPPPPPSGKITVKKSFPKVNVDESSTSSPKPKPQNKGGEKSMDSVIQELSMSIGGPKQFIHDDEPEYNPSMVRPGYRPPPNLPQGGTQGEENVLYSIKGPTIVKVQSMAVFQLFCRNESQQIVDIDSHILEAEMIEERNGDSYKGLINREKKGVFKVQFRGRNVGKYHFNIYVKGRMEKKTNFYRSGSAA